MNSTIDWDKTVTFTGYISQPKYSHITIPTVLTYRELFVIIGTLMLTCNSAGLLGYDFGKTVYGDEDPRVFVRDFDLNTILLAFYSCGMIEFEDVMNELVIAEEGKRINLTEEGKKFLLENRNAVSIDFCEKKRQEARKIIKSDKTIWIDDES